ncbi:tRNA-splicing endonuclease subunit Sen15 [Xylariaceae sp. FL1272]|nr:tRNA-splicing endonuclease subunit Sen15 [Xylariaceae sp. FL1272]
MAAVDDTLDLARIVLDNLQWQHDWTQLQILTHSPTDGTPFPRPIVFGLPPRRLYVHPDDQVALVRSGEVSDKTLLETPEFEWVLPTYLAEKWSTKAFADVFDSLPSQASNHPDRPKRIVFAPMHSDSTVTYYIMHDGIVKPRQN